MREPPIDLAADALRACLRDHYGIAAGELVSLPLGADIAAWAFRVRSADGSDYFLKVRTRVENAAGLLVPRALRDSGIEGVVAPLPTATGTLWAAVGPYAALLYPFIAGETGMARGMSDQQWVVYGALLRRVHEAAPGSDLLAVLGRESFAPDGADTVRQLDERIGGWRFADPAMDALATFWRARRGDILTLLARAESLGRRLAESRPSFVVCHADIHTNNILVGDDGRVWFVDWDDTLLAPRERDLMFAVGGLRRELVGPREEAHFFAGYGTVEVDPLALAYYRYARAVSDLAYTGAQVFFRPDFGPERRREAAERSMRLFQPGYLVELAFASAWPE